MRPRLSMRAWTERDAGATDPFGGGEDWQDQLTEQPCYWWVTSGREHIDQNRTAVLADERVLFDRQADVRPGDRVRRLVDHERRVIFDTATAAGAFREVEHVAVERTFLSASLRASG